MKTPHIVKRLVREIGTEQIDEDENLPIEYYELRELAKTRVLLKSSLKTHFFVYLIVNLFVVILNILGNIPPVESFLDLWSLWSVLGWGLLLLAHAMILATYNIPNLEYRIFIITSVISIYIGLFLIYLNYYLRIANNDDEIWWYWPDIAILLFIAAYAWIVFYSENKEKFNSRIEREMEFLRERREQKSASVESQIDKSLTDKQKETLKANK
ncbi:2TM domain-containing protein [Candidatus Harpocratesius sp.]